MFSGIESLSLIDIGSVSNSRKDFLEPDLIENISAESIAKTDLEN